MTSGETKAAGNDGLNWRSRASTGGGSATRREQKRLNTATIVKLRKTLVAAEWRRALGRPQPDHRLEALEREASEWRQAEDEKRRKAEAERRRLESEQAAARAALAAAGMALAGAGEAATPERAEACVEEAFEEMGELVDLVWWADGCTLYLEPWRGRRRGRAEGYLLEVIVDELMELAALRHIPPGERQTRIRWEAQLRGLREAFEGDPRLSREMRDRQVQQTLDVLGRVISFEPARGGWTAEIEPWEVVRANRHRRSAKPVTPVALEFDSRLWIRSLASRGRPGPEQARRRQP